MAWEGRGGLGRPGGKATWPGLSRGGACGWSHALSWWVGSEEEQDPSCHFKLHLDLWGGGHSLFPPRPLSKLLAATLLSRSV